LPEKPAPPLAPTGDGISYGFAEGEGFEIARPSRMSSRSRVRSTAVRDSRPPSRPPARSRARAFHLGADGAQGAVTELGADVDPFVLHLFAALAQKEQQLISKRTRIGGRIGGAALIFG
jgi:hypothetical protein